MKYLYVLVSNESDCYFEQLILSITSLRIKVNNAFVSLLVDNKTATTFKGNREKIYTLIDEYKIVELPDNMSNKERSRWLKTSMRQYIEGDFLFIDCDTVIADDLIDITNLDIEIGAVLAGHWYLETWAKNNKAIYEWRQKDDKKLGFVSSIQSNTHFNSGVLFCRNTKNVYNFFDEWHKLWLICVSKKIYIDQPAFNQANYNYGIVKELAGIWNYQVLQDGGMPYLANAKIIHYFGSGVEFRKKEPYLFANLETFIEIKTKGELSSEIIKKLENPKNLFDDKTRLVIPTPFMDSVCYRYFNKAFNLKLLVLLEAVFKLHVQLRQILKNMKKWIKNRKI